MATAKRKSSSGSKSRSSSGGRSGGSKTGGVKAGGSKARGSKAAGSSRSATSARSSKGTSARSGGRASAKTNPNGRSGSRGGGSGARTRSGGSAGRSKSTASSQATTDHDQIREWAEARGGKPSCVRGTGGGDDTGMIRIDFPGYSGGGGDSLQEISWEEFFEQFDEQGLALVYQEKTKGGEPSNFNKLVSRETADAKSGRGGGGGARGGGKGSRGRGSK